MLINKHFKVSDVDYSGNIATTYQWQIQGNLHFLEVAFFHVKYSKFVLEFAGNVDGLQIADGKICLVDVEDQIHEMKVKQCTGAGDCGQKRFASKTCFNQSIKSVRLVIEM